MRHSTRWESLTDTSGKPVWKIRLNDGNFLMFTKQTVNYTKEKWVQLGKEGEQDEIRT